jgi:hypothetical protein
MGGQPHYPTDDDAAAVLKQCAVHDSRDSRSSRSSRQRPSQGEWRSGCTARGNGEQPARRKTGAVSRASGGPGQACDLEQWIGRREAEAGSRHDLQQGGCQLSGALKSRLSKGGGGGRRAVAVAYVVGGRW